VRTLAAPKTVGAFSAQELCVVLDAGHGGVDGGVVGRKTGLKESDVNLSIVYRLKEGLEEVGFAVTLTRKTEAGLYDAATKGFKKRDMQKRKEIIAETDPALVISIHQNFYPSKNTRGAQVFFNKKNEGGEKLALGLQKRLNALYAESGANGRVAASGEFFMLQCADCPSVIVECGFLSSPADEALLTDEVWQKKLAETLGGGVLGYFADLTA
jgi:N-acetylmuramoyl-L-alanine amidase